MTAQVRKRGNSVCPPTAAAFVRAKNDGKNVPSLRDGHSAVDKTLLTEYFRVFERHPRGVRCASSNALEDGW